MRDTLLTKTKLNECGILNLHSSSGSGTHWVIWFKKGKDKFYFDSYGVQPPSELIAYLKSPIFCNRERIQQNGEMFCGHLCLFALKQLSLANKFSSCNKLFNIIIIKVPVDKFGRNGDRTTTVYTGTNIANLTNSFLRRDGGNTAIEAIDLNSNIIKKCGESVVKSRCCNQELCRHKRFYYCWQCCVWRY